MFPQLIHLIFLLSSFKELVMENTSDDGFKLTIFHTNNIHGRFNVQPKGGLAKISTVLNEARAKEEIMLYLDAGGVFVGSELFFVHGENVTAPIMNYLKPDAVTLGFTEFQLGLNVLKSYLEKLKFPVIISNIIYNDKKMNLEKYIKTKLILETGGKKIGILGFLDPIINKMYATKQITFRKPFGLIKALSKSLKTIDKVDFVIVLSHVISNTVNLNVLKLDDVDVIVSGSFLLDTDDDDSSPIIFNEKSVYNKKRILVFSECFTKTLGYLEIIRTKDIQIGFNTFPLSLKNIENDGKLIALIKPFNDGVEKFNNEIIGTSTVFLDGENCWKRECNYGNLLTDSMIQYRSVHYKGLDWSDTSIAIISATSIRKSVNPVSNDYKITKMDIVSSIDYNQMLYLIELDGINLRDILDYSLKRLESKSNSTEEEKALNQKFLSVSGIYVVYDYNQTDTILVRCSHCRVPKYSDISSTTIYKIVTSQYLVFGGDGYTQIEKNAKSITPIYDRNLAHIFIDFIKGRKNVYPELQERIIIIEQKEQSGCCNTIISVFLLLLLPINFILYF